jgi:hypothetical protein
MGLRARSFCCAFYGALALALGLAPALPATAGQPNVVIFVADDLGWADVGFHGEESIETPSLDRLAREGVQLDRFYTTPICSPTRAALMTGRDPMRLGVAYGVIMAWHTIGIHPDEHFMPESFKAAGYQTAMVGKWHLGHAQMTYHPNQRGFEHFYGHLHTEVGYFPPFANQGGRDFQVNGKAIEGEGYESFLLADEASRWIRERDEDKPFFLYIPFIAPHTPLDAPDDLKAKYEDLDDDRKPARSHNTDQTRRMSRLMMLPSARPMYAAVVDGMDQAIGRVLDTLDEQGLADDTIVLFFSDNGGAAYATGGADNVPLRGGKGRWEIREHHVRHGRLSDPGLRRGNRAPQRVRARRAKSLAGDPGRRGRDPGRLSLLRFGDADSRRLQPDGFRRRLEAGSGDQTGLALRGRHELSLQDLRGPLRDEQPRGFGARGRGSNERGDPCLAPTLPGRRDPVGARATARLACAARLVDLSDRARCTPG